MNTHFESRWAGLREVMGMSAPIVLGTLSSTLMNFVDQAMVAGLGTNALAAVGSSGLWSYILGCFIFSIVGCVSTFSAQCLGRGELHHCARYAWQGIYLSLVAGALSLVLWPLSGPIFGLMGHNEEVTRLEVLFFQIRLFGYIWVAWITALSSFFQAVRRPIIPMLAGIAANVLNLALNYLLIYGHGGFPKMGVAGSATATVLAMLFQTIILQWVFMGRPMHKQYATRSTWQFDYVRMKELIRIGFPAGFSAFMDVANWGIFTSFIVGRFGEIQLASHNVAMNFMALCFMPGVALNQGIAAIVGNWIGQKDIRRAKVRTFTAMKIAIVYMFGVGVVFAIGGRYLIELFFSADPDVIALGHTLLIISAFFQAFDAINIICMGALRGAGDTRWMAVVLTIGAYCFFLPLAWTLAWPMQYGAKGAWIGATIYIVAISGVLFQRFYYEKWRHISIFSQEA